MIPASWKRKRRIIVYGLVTRYGPRTNCQRKRLKKKNKKTINWPKTPKSKLCNIFLQLIKKNKKKKQWIVKAPKSKE